MANSSDDPGKRGDRPEDGADAPPPGSEGGSDPGAPGGTLTAAGRDDLVDPDAPDRTLVAAGRDDLAGDHAAGGGTTAQDGIEDRTVPALDDDPLGPGGREPPHEAHGDDGDDHAARSGFAATALKVLVFVLVIFGLSLWLVPNIAPHLPAGIARHLMPGQVELDERLAALTQQIEAGTGGVSAELAALREEVSALAERVESVEEVAETARDSAADSAAAAERNAVAGEAVARAEAAAAEANRLADTATTAATEAGKVAASATRDTASLARRMAGFEARVAELSDRVQAVGDSLAEGVADGEASTPELSAAVADLRAEVQSFRERLSEQPNFVTAADAERFATQDDLRSARLALGAEIGQALQALPPGEAIVVEQELQALRQEAEQALGLLRDRIAEVQATADRAARTAGSAEEAATAAVGRVDDAIRNAALRAAAAALTSRLANGVPFADALDEAAALMGEPPPAPLSAVADTGVPTTDELLRRFGRPARDALEADIEARSGGGILGQAGARVRTVISGRPAGEQPGDTVEAVLSRIEARLREGDAAAALAEAEALPEPSQAALGEWLDALRARVAAAEAAEQWLSPGAAGTQG